MGINNMKIFIAFLTLILSSQFLVKAEEIKNFEIEGMSIGESALKYFDNQYIKDAINHKNAFKYKDNKFVTIGTINNYEKYDEVGIIIMPNDKNFTIYALEGILNYGNKINKCYEQQQKWCFPLALNHQHKFVVLL